MHLKRYRGGKSGEIWIHLPFLTTFLEWHCGHIRFLSSRSIIGMLLIMNMGEVPSGEKSSRDVDILLNSVYGAFLNHM